MSELRCWFLRDVFDALEREKGSLGLEQMLGKLPPRLRPLAAPARLRASGPTDTLPLGEGEELLLAIDASIGDGSGRVLEAVSTDIFSRTLSFGGVRASSGDLYGTVARLQAAFERPFVGVTLVFELQSTATGFTLSVGIPGRPRAARILRHLAIGAIRAAQRHSHGSSMDLKLFGETLADRSNVTARYRAAPENETASGAEATTPLSLRPLLPPTPERRSSRNMRAITQPRLSEEVERILSSAPSLSDVSASRPPRPERPAQAEERERTSSAPPEQRSSAPPPGDRDYALPDDGAGDNGDAPSSTQPS